MNPWDYVLIGAFIVILLQMLMINKFNNRLHKQTHYSLQSEREHNLKLMNRIFMLTEKPMIHDTAIIRSNGNNDNFRATDSIEAELESLRIQ